MRRLSPTGAIPMGADNKQLALRITFSTLENKSFLPKVESGQHVEPHSDYFLVGKSVPTFLVFPKLGTY